MNEVSEGPMRVFGPLPPQEDRETKQFRRVLDSIRRCVPELGGWVTVLMNFDYSHSVGGRIENDKKWDGQFDIIVLASHRIVIYELKAQKLRILYGRSDASYWELEYPNGKKIQRRSYFDQVSKQRAFFLQEYLNRFKENHTIPQPNHYVVDARVVLLPGSDTSGFYYKIPVSSKAPEFETEILANISDPSEHDFVRDSYSNPKANAGTVRLNQLSDQDYDRMEDIWKRYGLERKTAKWFLLLTEDQIEDDLRLPGYEDFTLAFKHTIAIATEFGLA